MMRVSSRSALPVVEYIMNQFSEPYNLPSHQDYTTIYMLLSSYINSNISYEDVYKSIEKLTNDCRPVEKLRTIIEVPPQPLSSSASDSTSSDEINSKKKFQNWSTIEDERLLCGIIRFGFDNWTTIANFVGNNRTRSQCNQRWNRGLDPHISRDQWTPEETQKLLSLVKTHGEKSWTHISSVMGNRSDVQCRYHFYQITKKHRFYVNESPLYTTNFYPISSPSSSVITASAPNLQQIPQIHQIPQQPHMIGFSNIPIFSPNISDGQIFTNNLSIPNNNTNNNNKINSNGLNNNNSNNNINVGVSINILNNNNNTTCDNNFNSVNNNNKNNNYNNYGNYFDNNNNNTSSSSYMTIEEEPKIAAAGQNSWEQQAPIQQKEISNNIIFPNNQTIDQISIQIPKQNLDKQQQQNHRDQEQDKELNGSDENNDVNSSLFNFNSKFSGFDDLIDEPEPWFIDRCKSCDVTPSKYNDQFIF